MKPTSQGSQGRKGVQRPLFSRMVPLVLAGMTIAAVILGAVFFFPFGDTLDDAQRIEMAQAALLESRYQEAEQIALEISAESPLYVESRLLAGESAMRSGRNGNAIEYFEAIEQSDHEKAVVASFSLGELYRSEGRLSEAISALQKVLGAMPGNGDAHARLAFLYGVTGQRWESMPHHLALIPARDWTIDSLALLGDIERPIEQPDFLEECRLKAPEDSLVQLGLASQALQNGEEPEALGLVEKVVVGNPTLLPAQALMGELLLAAEPERFEQWKQQLPAESKQHPDIWFVLGMKARSENRLKLAAGCFAETVRLRPEHRRGTYQLGQVLALLEDPNASVFVKRAERLVELTQKLDEVLKSRGQSEAAIRRVAEISVDTGRYLEAWAWATTAARFFPGIQWPAEVIQGVLPELDSSGPRTIARADLLAGKTLPYREEASRFLDARLPTEGPNAGIGRTVKETERTEPQGVPQFRLEDVGIKLVYENGADASTRGARMFEQTGGGVGVLDYDLDGWPDLYFTQGTRWPEGQIEPSADPQWFDHLYRNLEGAVAEEVSRLAGIDGLEFGQGVAVGDYDNDGFPDLFVSNVGRNRLWRNNGDGTFSDQTEQMSGDPLLWSTSAAFADFDGDHLPDLFVVDYLAGDDVYTRICGDRGCSPKVFQGAADEFYRNNGDGSFSRVLDATPASEAKGLGLLVARFGDDNFLSIFVANDQVPNFFLQPKRTSEATIQFQDRALLRGLAYNVDGLAMACMGIAAEDLDSNGRLDLLVTNFRDEPNTLYLQDAPGLFVDGTRAAGLQGPSYPYVGWGTQFLDADLDGQADLVVTNGHIDDYRDEGGMYHMPPQFFRNRGRGRFELIPGEQAGDYFRQMYLGRGLARVDWNRDGKMDFVSSNIGQPATLVTNQTVDVGNRLGLQLIGTLSARDPVGAIVEVKTSEAKWSKQWVAGDGFQASNERGLQFGLGQSNGVDQVLVRWPSGGVSQVDAVPVNQVLVIVEGADMALMGVQSVPVIVTPPGRDDEVMGSNRSSED